MKEERSTLFAAYWAETGGDGGTGGGDADTLDGHDATYFAVASDLQDLSDSIDEERAAVERSGFVDPSAVTVSYDSSTRKVTVTQTGGVQVMLDGVIETVTSPWTNAVAHADVDGVYYCVVSFTGRTPSLSWNVGAWTFDQIQVAFVNYRGAASTSTFAQRECHGIGDYRWHDLLHHQIGTYKESGGTLTAGTYSIQPASPTDTDNRPGVDTLTIADEDLQTALDAWLTGTYTTLTFTGSGTPSFDVAATEIYRKPSGTFLHYNPYNGSTFSETEGATNKFYNVYLIAMPASADAQSQKHRLWWLQPRAEFSTATAAAAEDFRTLYLGTLTAMSSEFVAIARVTLATSSSYSSTVGRCRIHAVSYLSGSKSSQVLVGAALIPAHNALYDRDAANAHPASSITYSGGLAATDVQGAIDEVAAASRVPLAASLTAPGGVVYSGGAVAPEAAVDATWGSLVHKTGTGTVTVQLWDLTDDAEVDSTTSTSTTPELVEVVVTITADHLYEVRIWTSGTADTDTAILGSSYLKIGA